MISNEQAADPAWLKSLCAYRMAVHDDILPACRAVQGGVGLRRSAALPHLHCHPSPLSHSNIRCCTIPHCLLAEQYREEWGDEVVQSCNWAGATCAVVAASPLIGKVAQLSYERTLGTLTGGMLGFLVSNSST
jgi:hypothetical protein